MNKSLTATLKYALTSYKKMQLVAKLVQGKNVDEALTILEHTPKASAKMLWKVIKSAQANAVNNAGQNAQTLYISHITVGRGPKLKRSRFVARSRIHGYVKHRAFVRVVLDNK